jgi:hypothetical protein
LGIDDHPVPPAEAVQLAAVEQPGGLVNKIGRSDSTTSGREVTELVVYPQEYKVWGREGVRPIRVRCQDAPAWFVQWADATRRVETMGEPLVLGRRAADRTACWR